MRMASVPQILRVVCRLLLISLLLTSLSYAAVPRLIRYQGALVDSEKLPLADATYTITFRLYNAATEGTALWEESHAGPNAVPVTNGTFTVLLGSITAFDQVAFDQPLWLTIQLEGEPEMSPRQQLTSVPFALTAESLSGGTITVVEGKVGIGTTTPTALLHLRSPVANQRTVLNLEGYTDESEIRFLNGDTLRGKIYSYAGGIRFQ